MQHRLIHRWISFALPRSVKLLDLLPGLSLMSVDILPSVQLPDLEVNSVDSCGGVATAERSVKEGLLL